MNTKNKQHGGFSQLPESEVQENKTVEKHQLVTFAWKPKLFQVRFVHILCFLLAMTRCMMPSFEIAKTHIRPAA